MNPFDAYRAIADGPLTGRMKHVALSIWSFADSDTLSCFPSVDRIAIRAGLSRRATFIAIRELEAIGRSDNPPPGALSVKRRDGHSTTYTLLIQGCKDDTRAEPTPVQELHRRGEEAAPLGVKKLHYRGEEAAHVTAKERPKEQPTNNQGILALATTPPPPPQTTPPPTPQTEPQDSTQLWDQLIEIRGKGNLTLTPSRRRLLIQAMKAIGPGGVILIANWVASSNDPRASFLRKNGNDHPETYLRPSHLGEYLDKAKAPASPSHPHRHSTTRTLSDLLAQAQDAEDG